MVSSTGSRLLVAALVIALGQLLSSSVPTTYVGTHQPRFSPGRQQELQRSKVTAHFFKKLLNRKKTANVVETAAPDNLDAAVVQSTGAALVEAALEAAKPAPLGKISTLPAQVAEPARNQKSQLEPVVNLKIDDVVPSQPVKAQEVAVVESTEEADMDDYVIKVAEVQSPVASLLKKEDDVIYDFFCELTVKIESLWQARTAKA